MSVRVNCIVCGGGALIVLALVGYAMLGSSGSTGVTASKQRAPIRKEFKAAQDGAKQSKSAKSPESGKSKARFAKTLDEVSEAIVKFEMPRPGGMSTGAGFLVDDRGWIATSNHVASKLSTAARVKTFTGRKVEIDGVIAVAPERDLAIVKLKKPAAQLMLLDISYRDRPKLGTTVYAYGHPQNVDFSLSKGIVSRVLTTGELVADQPAHIIAKIKAPADALWIQTDAKILPGNSGGPLLDENSRVIGVNTFLNVRAMYGYASHVKYLKDMVDKSTDRVSPLMAPSEVLPPQRPSRGSRSGLGADAPMPQITVSRQMMQRSFAAAAVFAWKPARLEDYNTLADLAAMMTASKQPQAPAALAALADQLFVKMQEVAWADDRASAINQYAAGQIATGRGAMLIGTILGKGNAPSGGGKALIVKVPGAAHLLMVPARAEVADTPIGSRLLVLGVILRQTGQTHLPGQAQPQAIRVIQSHYMLPVK